MPTTIRVEEEFVEIIYEWYHRVNKIIQESTPTATTNQRYLNVNFKFKTNQLKKFIFKAITAKIDPEFNYYKLQ